MHSRVRERSLAGGRRGLVAEGIESAHVGPTATSDVGRLFFLLAMLMSSFDIFLSVKIYGFTLRAAQVLLLASLLYALGETYTERRLRVPLGFLPLLLWTAFIFAFIPNTSFLERSIGYGAWLLLDILAIWVAVQLFDSEEWLRVLLRWYVASFLVLSLAGVLQFAVAVTGLASPFVVQWLASGIPRINGFSYEPSYYASYLLLGWVFCAWMIEKGSDFVSRRLVYAAFAASTVALILATSRLGWAMMILWGSLAAVRRVLQFKPPKLSLGGWLLALNFTGLTALAILFLAATDSERMLRFFAGGTGLLGTPAHSLVARQNTLLATIDLFLESPLVGYSLGGVGPAIGEREGEEVVSNEVGKRREGMSVFAEVLAASGAIGVIPFVIYLGLLFTQPIRAVRHCDPARAAILVGLVWALGFELLILQFNQNILRLYLWFHIGVLSAAYAVLSTESSKSIPHD